jgi:hypothetical protein
LKIRGNLWKIFLVILIRTKKRNVKMDEKSPLI